MEIKRDVQIAKKLKSESYDHIIFVTDKNPLLAEFYLHYLTGRRDYNEALPPGRAKIHFASSQAYQAVFNGLKTSNNNVNIEVLNDANDLSLVLAEYVQEGAARKLYTGARQSLQDWNIKYQAYKFAAQQLAFVKNGHQTLVFSMVGELMERFGVWMTGIFNHELGNSKSNAITGGDYLSEALHAVGQAVQSEAKIAPAYIRMNTGRGDALVIRNTLNPDINGFRYNVMAEIAARSIEAAVKEQGRESQSFDFNVTTLEELGQTVEMMEMSARMAGLMAGKNEEDHTKGLEEKVQQKIEAMPEHIALASGQSISTQNILGVEKNADGQLALTGVIIEKAGVEYQSRLLGHALKVLGYLINKKSGGISKTVDSIGAVNDLVHLNPKYTREGLRLTEAMAREFQRYKKVYVAAIGGSLTGDYLMRLLSLNQGPKVVFLTDLDPVRAEIIDREIKEDPDGTAILILTKSGNTLETDVAGGFLRTSLKEAFAGRSNLRDLLAEHTLAITDAGYGSNMRREVEEASIRSLPHPPHGGRFSMFSSLGLFFYFLEGGKRRDLEKALSAWEKQNETLTALVDDVKKYSDVITGKKDASQEEKLAAIKNVLAIMQRYPGMVEGFLMTFINTLDQVDPKLKKNVHVALSMDDVMGQMVNPKTPFMQQLFIESLSKSGTDDYTIPVAGWPSVLEQLNRIVSHPHAFVSFWLQRTDTIEGRRAYAENQVLREQMTQAGIPYMSYETGPMDVMNLANMMRMIYMWLEISAQAYGDKIPVSSKGQGGVDLYKEKIRMYLEVINGRIASKVLEEADARAWSGMDERLAYIRKRTLEERGKITVSDIPIVDFSKQMGGRFTLDDFAMDATPEDVAIKKFFDHFIGIGFPDGLVTRDVRKAIKELRPHQISGYLRDRVLALIKPLAGERLSELILDGKTVEQGSGDWVIVADSLDYPENIIPNKAYGSHLAIFRKNPKGGFRQEDLIASFFVQWGIKPTVIYTMNGKTRKAELLSDGILRVIDTGTEDRTVKLGIRGTHAAFGGKSSEWPEGFRAFRQEHEEPVEKLTARYSGRTLATNLNLMLGKDGIVVDWMTWPQALMLSQTIESSSGVCMLMTPQGLKHIHELIVTENQFKDGEQVFVYAGTMNLVKMIEVWMNFLNVRDRKDFHNAPIIKIVDLIRNLPDNSPDTLKAAALVLLLRLQTSLSFYNENGQLKGDVKLIIAELRASIHDLLENKFKVNTVQKALENRFKKDLQLAPGEWKNKRAQYVLFGDPESEIGAKLKTGDDIDRLYQLHSDFNAITSWDLIAQLRAQMVRAQEVREQIGGPGFDLTASLAVLDQQVQVLEASYAENDKPLIKPHEEVVIPVLTLGKTDDEYLQDSVQMPEGHGLSDGVSEATRQQLFVAEKIIKKALVAPTVIELAALHPRQRDEYEQLRIKHPSIFTDLGDGKVEILSLMDIMETLSGQKGGSVNASGDVGDRLDHIFDIIFNNQLLPHVSVIISEERKKPVFGIAVGEEGQERM